MRSSIKSFSQTVRDHWLFIGVVLLTASIHFYGLGRRPLDGDEAVILKLVNQPFSDFWRGYTVDVHPPLHHILTWLSIHIFGVSEWSLRLVPALSGSLLSGIVYMIGKTFFNKKVGLFAGLMVVFSGYLLYFDQENRMYSLFTVLSTIALWQWLLFIKTGAKKNAWVWLVFLAAAAWTQHLGLVLGIIEISIALIFSKKRGLLLLLIVVGVLLYAPIARQTKSQFVGRLHEQKKTDYKANTIGVINAYYRFVPGRIFLDLDPSPSHNLNWAKTEPLQFIFFLVTLVLPFILFIWGLVRFYLFDRKLFLCLVVPSLGLVVLALVSSEIGGRAARYLSVIAPVVYLVIALGLSSLKKNSQWFLAGLLGLIFVAGVASYYQREQRSVGAREIAGYLSQNADWGDAVFARGAFLGGEETALAYYLEKEPKAPKLVIIDYFSNYTPGNLNELLTKNTNELVNGAVSKYHRVWYYDFTYQKEVPTGVSHEIGKDKENRTIILREITK